MRALLAVLLCLGLATPQGWASAAMYLCGSESAIHVGEHGDCCKRACPDHHDEDDSPCCSEMRDSDDRASFGADAPPPVFAVAALPTPVVEWPPRPVVAAAPTSSWWLGPPSVGPPPWLRFRMLLL